MKSREKRRRRQLRKARQRQRWRRGFDFLLEMELETVDSLSVWPQWLAVRDMTPEEVEAGRSL